MPGPDEPDDRILEGMLRVVVYMENYRAFYEARGFSREAAEAMTVRYHSIICGEVEHDLMYEHERRAEREAERAKYRA